MAQTLTPEDARQSLTAHVAAKGEEIHERYPRLGWDELPGVLGNQEWVRYPCEVVFSAEGLRPGEFAFAEPRGERPEAGFSLKVHPRFAGQPERVPGLVLYHLVTVNYGVFAEAEEAEVFGAAALGMEREAYYASLCAAADEVSADGPAGDELNPGSAA